MKKVSRSQPISESELMSADEYDAMMLKQKEDAEKDAALTNAWAKLRAAMNAHPRAVMTLVEEAYVILDTALAAKEVK